MNRFTCAVALALCAVSFSPPPLRAELDPGPEDVYLRVVDVGPGLCVVAVIPGRHYLVYDGGHWDNFRCAKAVMELVSFRSEIDLLVISHSDADHLANAPDVLMRRGVGEIWWQGLPRGSNSWEVTEAAIGIERRRGAELVDLQRNRLRRGTRRPLGDATVTVVGGKKKALRAWRELSDSEERNAPSIVIRLDYRGHSILLTGDTVGRRIRDEDDVCGYAEQEMVANADRVPLRADVVVAPHHGANNGSARCFVEAVAPDWVIFSAGHDHGHPTLRAAERYLAAGVAAAHLLRTDRGDDEDDEDEWKEGSVAGCRDQAGDDDVEVILPGDPDAAVRVAYRRPPDASGCGAAGQVECAGDCLGLMTACRPAIEGCLDAATLPASQRCSADAVALMAWVDACIAACQAGVEPDPRPAVCLP